VDRPFPAPRLQSPRLTAAIAIASVLVIGAVCAALYQPRDPIVAAALPTPEPTLAPTPAPTPTPSLTATPSPSPSPSGSPAPIAADALLGKDGRLTVLLLGSDYRPSHSGNRTDVIMVVSINPATGAVAAASIPRDTAGFPTSASGTYGAKINGLYQSLVGRLGQAKAASEMKRIIGAGIGVEIDSYAFIGFDGVKQLVNAVGGVDVVLAKSVSDPYYWVTSRNRGVFFPAGRNHLNGDRALIFSRTRKGDNDFERARRQQLLVGGAVETVRKRGVANLPKLIAIGKRYVKTDLPLASAPTLFEMVGKAKIGDAAKIVFGPTKWATGSAGTSFKLKLAVVREWTAEFMGPVKATAAPSPSPSPTPLPEPLPPPPGRVPGNRPS
jgi:polyisoprenyl-teichoic acid--peptidoglycan teichoic acid transferase